MLGQRVEGDFFKKKKKEWERIKGEPALDSISRAGGCEDLGFIWEGKMWLLKCMVGWKT